MFLTYLTDIMRGKRRGPADSLVSAVLRAASIPYAAGVGMVDLAYRLGIRKIDRPPMPVVSVGNLTLGGTGKTPMVVLVAEHFRMSGRKPAILTRGYGNDECRMFADEAPFVPVYRGQNRLKSAEKAFADGRDVAVLDDGFQHRKIARDLDLLLLDGIQLLGRGLMFPAGVMREPSSAAMRSDMVVLTKTDSLGKERIAEALAFAGRIAPGKPIVLARHVPVSFTDSSGRSLELGTLRQKDVCVVSGIVDPDYFERTIRDIGATVRKRFFYPDHHQYTKKDMDSIERECSGDGITTIVTTAKDFVKMRDLDVPGTLAKVLVLKVKMEITEGKESFFAGLDSVFGHTGR
ncbi:MAG TPA: tetraacyldisaccharide 4'-kinase [Candidatus Omnitrophota bacterium]|nr:tetraacyldisaccharide 4'-kinase [Candidatus Omnitrophota bacterium]